MDFRNEALNAIRMKQLLRESEFVDSEAVVIPEPNLALTTRFAAAFHASVHSLLNVVFSSYQCISCVNFFGQCRTPGIVMQAGADNGVHQRLQAVIVAA
jgi:hypothetical protein